MSKHVLVPFDGSPAAEEAVIFVTDDFPDATLTLLYVMEPMADYSRQRAFPGYTERDEFANEREKGEHLLKSAQNILDADRTVTTEIIAGSPARAIIDYADGSDVDHIVIGSHGRTGVSRFLLGSTAETVVRRSAIPVTVIRPDE